MGTKRGRERMVKAAIAFTQGTTLAPDAYERKLLAQFIAGDLTIYQALELLEVRDSLANNSEDNILGYRGSRELIDLPIA